MTDVRSMLLYCLPNVAYGRRYLEFAVLRILITVFIYQTLVVNKIINKIDNLAIKTILLKDYQVLSKKKINSSFAEKKVDFIVVELKHLKHFNNLHK